MNDFKFTINVDDFKIKVFDLIWRFIKGQKLLVLSLFVFICTFQLFYPQQVQLSEISSSYTKTEYESMKYFYSWLTPEIYRNIKINCNRYRLNPKFVCSLIQYESNGNPYAISRSNARGLMQVMAKYHYRNRNPKDLFNVRINIKLGCRILRNYMNLAKGNLIITLKNYNSGPNSRFYNWPYIRRILRKYNHVTKRMNEFEEIRIASNNY